MQWTAEDEDALHCLCQLPAGTARFRTLMTCDVCHRWFHPACVRLKVAILYIILLWCEIFPHSTCRRWGNVPQTHVQTNGRNTSWDHKTCNVYVNLFKNIFFLICWGICNLLTINGRVPAVVASVRSSQSYVDLRG